MVKQMLFILKKKSGNRDCKINPFPSLQTPLYITFFMSILSIYDILI